ncbi:Probable carboxylesterase 18, partial [Linum grandiflorum]
VFQKKSVGSLTNNLANYIDLPIRSHKNKYVYKDHPHIHPSILIMSPSPSSSDKAGKMPPAPPRLPWKVKLFVSIMSFAVDFNRRSDGTINRRLMSFFDRKSPARISKGVASTDVTVDPHRNLWFRLYSPTNTKSSDYPLPLIFFFHGGGFVFMAADSKPYDDLCRRLAAEIPAVVASVNYRLAPEHRCPSQYEDGFDVLKFVDENSLDEIMEKAGVSCKVDLKRCHVAGDSAGGNLAHHVAVKAQTHSFSKLEVVGNISIQPFFGGEERTASELTLLDAPFVTLERSDWMWKQFLPEGSDRNHLAAHVFVGEDISGVEGFPATVVFVGGYDPIKDWQKKYYEWLKRSGKEAKLVEYENAIHTFYAYPELPESAMFVDEVKRFVNG